MGSLRQLGANVLTGHHGLDRGKKGLHVLTGQVRMGSQEPLGNIRMMEERLNDCP